MAQTASRRRLSETVRPIAAAHLIEFSQEIRNRFPGNVTRVLLFGSRARGDARRGSDYDVAVFMKDIADRRRMDHALHDIAYPHILAGVPIRPVSLPEDYLSDALSGPFSTNLMRDGVEVMDGSR